MLEFVPICVDKHDEAVDLAIDRGLVADRAAVACKLGLKCVRVTQLLDLLLLAPHVLAAFRAMVAVDVA